MKSLKIIFYIILIIVALFLLVGLFLPTSYDVSRTIVIDKQVETVYDYVLDFNKRAMWDPWVRNEPDAKTNISGPEKSIGSRWSWEGEKTGTGSITIIEMKPNKMIKSELKFVSPRPSKSTVHWTFTDKEDSTEVTWSFSGNLSYPIERYVGLRMDALLGPDFKKGLQNLKQTIESLPDEQPSEEITK